MGLSMAIDRAAAEELIHELDNWRVFEDGLGQLRIRKKWRTKNFVKVPIDPLVPEHEGVCAVHWHACQGAILTYMSP